jgi:hypothetical protein
MARLVTIYLSRTLDGTEDRGADTVREDCPVPTCRYGTHDVLWRIRRVPLETGLYWRAARINGTRHLIEGSLPNVIGRIPRDAVRLSAAESHAIWCDDNESHTFGGPNIAAALRSAVRAENGRADVIGRDGETVGTIVIESAR